MAPRPELSERAQDRLARLAVTVGALLPWLPFLTFSVVFITDDYFASDVFNGEFPMRVLVGRMLRAGEWPTWTSQLGSGLPLGGLPLDPAGVLAFTVLPPAAALCAFVLFILLVSAHGGFDLARRLGATRPGAVLAGVAFSSSGYFATQLKHLAVVTTVTWLPFALALLDRALTSKPERPTRRWLWLALFGLVFAAQCLGGFPQSAYYCGLVYAAFTLLRAAQLRRSAGTTKTLGWLAATGVVTVLGAASSAVVLLPLAKLGAISDRATTTWDWATRLAYWPPNFLTFIVPYIHGDISDNSYKGPLFFWEDYGYVGIFTFALAVFAVVRERRRALVQALMAVTVVAYLFVLGRATPFYRLAYALIPGIDLFRFPTRFLVVVELGLALLVAVGVGRLTRTLRRRWPAPSRAPQAVAWALAALTVVDLTYHQPRQNPVVPAAPWLAPPGTVELLKNTGAPVRTFTPGHRDAHRYLFVQAGGWEDVEPYFEMRELLEPNNGGVLWNVASADAYASVSPRWFVDVWGDHNRELSVAGMLTTLDFKEKELRLSPRFPNFLRTYGVTHVLSPFPQRGMMLPFLGRSREAWVYRVEDARRARFVSTARVITNESEARAAMLAEDFDPNRVMVLADAPASLEDNREVITGGSAEVTRETQHEVEVTVFAPADGFLLLADTYYPGWTATVDDRPTPLYRANLSVRGVEVSAGSHMVRFHYEMPGLAMGARITVVSLALLLMLALTAFVMDRRAALRR